MGKSPHHIQSNQDFMEHLKGITLGPDEVMVSYDVRALFTSVPIQPSLEVIEKLLKKTLTSRREQICPQNISWTCWSSASGAPISSTEANSMSRWKELPWALPSPQLWQISTWRILRLEPYSHH